MLIVHFLYSTLIKSVRPNVNSCLQWMLCINLAVCYNANIQYNIWKCNSFRLFIAVLCICIIGCVLLSVHNSSWHCVNSAIVPSSNIRPVDTSVQALGVKRTSGFLRACNELARHQELTARPPLNSEDSSDEHESMVVATSRRRKVNSWLMLCLFCLLWMYIAASEINFSEFSAVN